MNRWWLLILAGLLECAWAVGLKYTDGFRRPWPSVATVAAIALSMFLLAIAARDLPIGTAYSIWVGIGALGSVCLGAILFGEPLSPARIACTALLLASLIGLKLTTPEATDASGSPPAVRAGPDNVGDV